MKGSCTRQEPFGSLALFAAFFDSFFSGLSSSFFSGLSSSFFGWLSSSFRLSEIERRLLSATVDDIFELFTSAESRNASSRNFERSKSSGVTAGASFTHATFKCTKANEGDFVAFGEGTSYGVDKCGQGSCHFGLSLACCFCNVLYELSSVHSDFLLVGNAHSNPQPGMITP